MTSSGLLASDHIDGGGVKSKGEDATENYFPVI